jgi:hypothetical protein
MNTNHICGNISVNSSYNEKLSGIKSTENQNTNFVFDNVFPEYRAFAKQCEKFSSNQTHHKRIRNTAHALCILDI